MITFDSIDSILRIYEKFKKWCLRQRAIEGEFEEPEWYKFESNINPHFNFVPHIIGIILKVYFHNRANAPRILQEVKGEILHSMLIPWQSQFSSVELKLSNGSSYQSSLPRVIKENDYMLGHLRFSFEIEHKNQEQFIKELKIAPDLLHFQVLYKMKMDSKTKINILKRDLNFKEEYKKYYKRNLEWWLEHAPEREEQIKILLEQL